MQLIDDFEPVPMLYFYIHCKSNLKKDLEKMRIIIMML